MQVRTTTIQVHALPKKPALQLHEQDLDAVGVYGVDVDIMDYPLQQATAALNAFAAAVSLNHPADFELHVFDPQKDAWLMTQVGDVDFPSDGDFTGKLDVHLLPVGTRLIGNRDELDQCDAGERVTPAGSIWTVLDIDRGSISLACEDTGAGIFASVCQLGTDFQIDKGYIQDAGLTGDDLEGKYSPQGGGEHPMGSRLMWREAVANEDTIGGYWAWVESEAAQARWDLG
ncbi:hypothetical protein [Pseudomonas sp.]|uniref:hypothetical protein n=1 Tax=Pseudomonas sp. TaxID=306 RepID=UPI00299E2D1D|nr:hypothetical protein [Pseudomonas sp.]MDX1366899.1 hypothetical protein [Pseudomonas sp.]